MARGVRTAGAAKLGATRGPPSPSALRLPRLWQRHCTLTTIARPTTNGPVNQHALPPVPARYTHTAAADPTTDPAPIPNTPSRLAFSEPGATASTSHMSRTAGGIVKWHTPGKLQLHRPPHAGGDWNQLSLPRLWLRDACPCSACVDPDSGQKTFSTTDLPDELAVQHAELADDGALSVTWERDAPSGGQSHTSVFEAREVESWFAGFPRRWGWGGLRRPEKTAWDRQQYEELLAAGRCRVSYSDWMAGEGEAFRQAFLDLWETGLIFVTDVPLEETEVERVASRIGPLQHTFYGWTWDVRSKPQAENVAYTSRFLGLHQDLMYHFPSPRLQLLHCLANSCEGGESLFSHGVGAAYELKLTQPKAYRDLTQLKTWFGYHKGGHHYTAARVTIKLGPNGLPQKTYWAPPFQEPFRRFIDKKDKKLLDWKAAATAFQTIVEAEANMLEVKLRPGECVIFDNMRVLHGRRQFATAEGSRWLKGAYVSEQTYTGAMATFLERMEAEGMTPPPLLTGWKEEERVKARIQERLRAGGQEIAQPSVQSSGE